MIIVRLAGGLGNQMFQYACGRALSCKHATALALDHGYLEDTTPRENFTRRDYALGIFGIDLYLPPHARAVLLPGHKMVDEKDFPPDAATPEPNKKLHLRGYFQDERYFASAADAVRQDFTFPAGISEENTGFFAALRAAEAPVSIHVRRGDYLRAGNSTWHGVCPEEYYRQAVNLIKAHVAHPTFFVFSADDPEWARSMCARLEIDFLPAEHTAPECRAYEDMQMMSLCRHNIIANSSFSWWGAWLNPNPHKMVIGPQRWFAAEEIRHLNPCPPGWIRL